MKSRFRTITLDDYKPYIGSEACSRILGKAENLRDLHVTNLNSTYYGGGVAELLSSLTLLMNCVGIKTGWRAIQGAPDFFSITKKMHNALQGGQINLTDRKKKIYENVICQNAMRNHLTHDIVIIHDPQPIGMINHYKKKGPWIWQCHIDISNRDEELWNYLKQDVEKYDAVITSLDDYKQEIETPQLHFMPAIDPFSIKNSELEQDEIDERLDHYDIPTDKPLIVQISRFDKWKDPEGVIKAFKKARKKIDARLVLLGNIANDDPEGPQVYQSLLKHQADDILIMTKQDTAMVNALQRKAAVVLQKSIREGFGLTVTEAMWKGTAVIGGNAGGIKYQIKDRENGFLVDSIDQTAERMVELINDRDLADRLGKKARETVEKKFLMTRLLEQYLDLFNSFETIYKLNM